MNTRKCIVDFNKMLIAGNRRLEVFAKIESECLLTRLIIPDELEGMMSTEGIKVKGSSAG